MQAPPGHDRPSGAGSSARSPRGWAKAPWFLPRPPRRRPSAGPPRPPPTPGSPAAHIDRAMIERLFDSGRALSWAQPPRTPPAPSRPSRAGVAPPAAAAEGGGACGRMGAPRPSFGERTAPRWGMVAAGGGGHRRHGDGRDRPGRPRHPRVAYFRILHFRWAVRPPHPKKSTTDMAVARETEDIARSLVKHQHEHPPVRDLNREADRRLTMPQRIAEDLGRLVGSWTFVVVQMALIACWLAANLLAQTRHWDPYPFLLLNLALTFEVMLWVSLLLMALNRLALRDRLRAQQEYEEQVKAEEETRALMGHLEAQDEVLLQILYRLDRSDRELRRLARRLGIEERAG